MDRRNSLKLAGGMGLAMLTTAFVPVRVNAQQRGDVNRSSDVAGMGKAEEQHAFDTLQAGAVALESSRVALQKAQDPWVKKFAQYEVAEQETIAEVIKSMGVKMPSEATTHKNAARQDLSALSGAEFDAAYLKAQADGHDRLLQIQETYIQSGKNMAHLGMAKLARGQIKEHIDLIKTIRGQVRSG